MMALSILLTALLFGYLVLQAYTAPDTPVLVVEVEQVERTSDALQVHVVLRNDGGVGVRTATVEVLCEEPAPSMTFMNVPASGKRRGVIVCPADADDITARVASWGIR